LEEEVAIRFDVLSRNIPEKFKETHTKKKDLLKRAGVPAKKRALLQLTY